MKQIILTTIAFLMVSPAMADGFRCRVQKTDLLVKVYNNVDPSTGTRTASTMVISDSFINAGNKTIAVFSDENGTLSNSGAHYIAKVDLRFKESGRKGELIGHTKLGAVSKIYANIDFSYADTVENGEEVTGRLILAKRNGGKHVYSMICARYLKLAK